MAKRIDGKAIAAQIKQELKEQVQQLAKDNITVTLAVIFQATDQNSPVIFPFSSTSILSAAGFFGSPGIVMIAPVMATTNPAPAET